MAQHKKPRARVVQMANLRKEHSLREIGSMYDITAERVRQLLVEHNLTHNNDCLHQAAVKRARQKEKDRVAKVNENAIRMYGSDLKAIKKIPQDKRNLVKRMYRQLRRCTKKSGYDCKINVNQYWAVWSKSRKFNKKGTRKNEYCFSRIDFEKDITLNNVIVEKRSDFCSRMGAYARKCDKRN